MAADVQREGMKERTSSSSSAERRALDILRGCIQTAFRFSHSEMLLFDRRGRRIFFCFFFF